jgi:hypothetical protein
VLDCRQLDKQGCERVCMLEDGRFGIGRGMRRDGVREIDEHCYGSLQEPGLQDAGRQ